MVRAWIGTSGFDYEEWKPGFYPADLPRKEFLRHYAARFGSVELNNTFYRMPTVEKIAAWNSVVPDDFRFSLKASRKITHQERLKTPSEALDYLLGAVGEFQLRLGAVLFQLPPFFKCDCARLSAFLDALPRDLPAAFEFRHDSWFTDDVYQILAGRSAALCINDSDDGTTPVRVTGGFAYVRLRRSQYPEESRGEWCLRIRNWVREGVPAFIYIKHEDNPDAPRIALEFAEEVLTP